MNKNVKELVEKLGCTIDEGSLYAPDNCHFIKDDEKPHHLCIERYTDDELLTILNRGVESCSEVHCSLHRGNRSPCGFWSSYNRLKNQEIQQNFVDELFSILGSCLPQLEYLESQGKQVLVADKVRNVLNKKDGANRILRYNIL